MQKAVIHMRAILGRIIFIGLSIQIVLGLLWMCCSFTEVQWFAESAVYVKASENLLCDEYTGILYPFLLMLTGKNYVLLCLLQLATAAAAGFCFLAAAGVRENYFRVWGSLVLLTVPMAMQCHMAVLPNSFTSSCFLTQLALVLSAIKKKHRNWVLELFGVHVVWLGEALLMPDYLRLGAVPVMLFWLYDAIKYCKTAGWRVCIHLLLVAAFAGMIVTVNDLSQTKGAYGKSAKNAESVTFQRIAWSSLEKYYLDWPEEVQNTFTTDEFLDTAKYPENMRTVLLPKIEGALGEETAKEYYISIGKYVLKNNYYQILYEVAWDAVGNILPVVATDMLLEGSGYGSYCGRNYEIMRADSPALTKNYVQYVSWWFGVGLVLTVVMQVLGLFTKQKRKVRSVLYPVAVCILSAGIMAVWYTMNCAGCWDYKNGLFTGALWFVWMIILTVKGVKEEL